MASVDALCRMAADRAVKEMQPELDALRRVAMAAEQVNVSIGCGNLNCGNLGCEINTAFHITLGNLRRIRKEAADADA